MIQFKDFVPKMLAAPRLFTPGEYEYRFIVDGVWIRDPNNVDYTRNEFGQENSLLIV